jgi:hypothetical protein
VGARFRTTYDVIRQTINLTYRYRFYARNFPSHAHITDLAWIYHY